MSNHQRLPLRSKKAFLIFCLCAGAVTILALILSVLVGSVSINSAWIGEILVNRITGREIFERTWENGTESIIWTIRFPRVLMAFLVGAGLSLSGILMQALTKNALADPYVLGISSGASAGAVAVIMYGFFSAFGNFHITVGASLGAVISIVIALRVSSIHNRITPTQLVLSGIAVSAFFSAITNTMIYYNKTGSDKVRTAMYWMMGSLSGATWPKVIYIFFAFLICLIVLSFFCSSLDVLMMGDDAASTLGLNLRRTRLSVIAICTILTGAIVSVSGVIGFVGLLIPHITRSIVGSKHARLIPASVIVGGTFVILCDVLCRVLVAPEELPLGVVTAFFGAPFFLFLIRKSGQKFGGAS